MATPVPVIPFCPSYASVVITAITRRLRIRPAILIHAAPIAVEPRLQKKTQRKIFQRLTRLKKKLREIFFSDTLDSKKNPREKIFSDTLDSKKNSAKIFQRLT
jgi:hypothetical protein